jgi:hypothetical protein
MPLGALILEKLIPILGVSAAVAGFGLSLVGVAGYFLKSSPKRRPFGGMWNREFDLMDAPAIAGN